ncbi:hypothetical protein [Streptomyces sp. NPDC048411]|uniref:hypothetical protein n=1 Tax=Streptomyces sp. NPDC048411 TaxID=3157206 RepID=UPI0034560F59
MPLGLHGNWLPTEERTLEDGDRRFVKAAVTETGRRSLDRGWAFQRAVPLRACSNAWSTRVTGSARKRAMALSGLERLRFAYSTSPPMPTSPLHTCHAQ